EEELFTMKAGWEFEFSLDMASLFAPVTMEQLIQRLDRREQVRLQKEAEERRKQAQSGDDHNHNHNQGSMGMGSMGSGMMGGMGGLGGGNSASRQTINSMGGR
ncbi:MAG: hypothetical protein IJ976_02640, partial [Alistipes sp.]|nr:hypothetical protein [Alistipes sp.]